uniref:Uncharacterized protein n=1 Tax=Rhizophora mucronata TaxID=61149 RepID=A0A2P2QJT9_RHIMU
MLPSKCCTRHNACFSSTKLRVSF